MFTASPECYAEPCPPSPKLVSLPHASCQALACREEETGEGAEQAEKEGASGRTGGSSGLSFWGVASVLTATVKAKTAEVLTAVHDTDWRAELEAFQQVGAGTPASARQQLVGRRPHCLQSAHQAAQLCPARTPRRQRGPAGARSVGQPSQPSHI